MAEASKMNKLISAMRGDPLISNETKSKDETDIISLLKPTKAVNKYSSIISEMRVDSSKPQDTPDINQMSEEDMEKIRKKMIQEQLENLKKENPAEYYRLMIGIRHKTTSKKQKRKRRIKHT